MRTRITALALALLLLLPLLAGCGAGTGAPDGLITGLVEEGMRQGAQEDMTESYGQEEYGGGEITPVDTDTDGDGATDLWEKNHHTDPETPDELFAVQEECEGDVMSATVSTHTDGEHAEWALTCDTAGTSIVNRNVPGWLGDAFVADMEDGFTQPASICIRYDEGFLPEGADPVIYYCGLAYSEENEPLTPLETSLSPGQATASITQNGVYALMDRTVRDKVEEALR